MTWGGIFMQTDRDISINVYDEHDDTIKNMELGDAVKRITAHELPMMFEEEAAKALAVAVRTSIIKRLKQFDGSGCESHSGADICTGMRGCDCVADMELLKEKRGGSFEGLYKLAYDAVEKTSGFIITCRGKPINIDYHMTCGGGTQNSEDVVGNRVIYLRKVLCGYCSDSPHWERSVDITVSEIESRLGVKIARRSSTAGPLVQDIIEDVERDETGRVKRISIGGKYFTGVQLKELLGLDSSRFGWDVSALRFKMRGMGSGLGMCLYGANGMAKQGRTFDEILKYYYTNTEIHNIDDTVGDGPLKGRIFVIDPGHGGDDRGDRDGPTGLAEKDVNLDIAARLASRLESAGAKVAMTREDDVNPSLQKRIELVNSVKPNFFISVHQNSFFSPGAYGTETLYYRGDRDGERLGALILNNIASLAGTSVRGNKVADLYLLRESKVSSVEVECMHITNPTEEERLRDPEIRERIAEAIFVSVLQYYGA